MINPAILVLPLMMAAQPETAVKTNVKIASKKAFKPGEKLTYRLTYGIMDAGEAVLKVSDTSDVNGKNVWKVEGVGKTLSVFEWFYKVNDVYTSFIDQDRFIPYQFRRRVDEGGHKIKQDYSFDHDAKTVTDQKGKRYTVIDDVQDMISCFYYARSLDLSNLRKGQEIEIPVFLDAKIYHMKVKYLGKEEVKIRKGKFKAMKFCPVVQEGRVFESEKDLEVWISDDGNKIPILAKAKIKVGTVKMHLTKWEGLAHTMAKI